MSRYLLWIGAVALTFCFVAGIVVSQKGFDIPETSTDQLEASPFEEPLGAQVPLPDPALTEDEDAPTAPPEPQAGIPGVPPPVPFHINMAYIEDGRYVVRTADGHQIILTLDPDLQNDMGEMMRRHQVPHAAFAALEPSTGRVLALVSEESAKDPIGDVALKAMAPSASIFKIITSAALIEGKGFDPSQKTCYPGGGPSKPSPEDIQGVGAPDDTCVDLHTAFGNSDNYVFTKLAHRHLNANELRQWSARFGYDEPMPFNMPTEASRAQFDDDPIKRALTAAGFWHTTLTPLHSAAIAATIANGGLMMRPNIIETILDPDGETVYSFMPVPYKRVVSSETARKIADMMVFTTTVGTASKHMRNPNNLPADYIVAGKTGTLTQRKPYLMFSWFAGFAPIERPEIAVGTLLCNPAKWRIKAAYAASRGIKLYRDKRVRRQRESEAALLAEALKDDAQTPSQEDVAPQAPLGEPDEAIIDDEVEEASNNEGQDMAAQGDDNP